MTSSRARGRSVARSLVWVMAVAMLAAGCSSSGGPSAGTELVWAATEIDRGVAQGIADLWNQGAVGRPKVRIELLPNAADDQRRLMAIELNAELPRFDILTLDVVWTGEFAGSGWIANLDELRGRVADRWLAGPLESATWRGKLWAAPFTSSAGILYYRADLLDGPPPKTWAELEQAIPEARRKAGTSIAGLVAQGAQYEGLVVNFLEHVWGAGGDLSMGKDASLELSTDAAIAALTFMRDQFKSGGLYSPKFDTMKESDALAEFAAGNAIFMRNWPYAWDRLAGDLKFRDKVGIAPLPTHTGKGASAATGGANLAVNRFSRNIDAARAFVEFATTDTRVQVRLGTQSRPPALASAYDDPQLAEKKDMRLLGEVLRTAHARPATPEWSAISDEIQQQVFPAYKGRRDVTNAVASIQSFLKL